MYININFWILYVLKQINLLKGCSNYGAYMLLDISCHTRCKRYLWCKTAFWLDLTCQNINQHTINMALIKIWSYTFIKQSETNKNQYYDNQLRHFFSLTYMDLIHFPTLSYQQPYQNWTKLFQSFTVWNSQPRECWH